MEFGILGPLEVRADGRSVPLGGAKPRAVLALLALHANQPVSAERVAVALWGEDAPPRAVKTVQVYISRLRKALDDADVLLTTPAGYRLRVQPGELDAERFDQLVASGRRALGEGREEEAAAELREALGLWRGPPLAELASTPFAPAEIARLEEQHLAALELRVEADLIAGRHAELISELQQLTTQQPWRERLHVQLMLALYRGGRQADALEAYRHAREVLVEQLGIEPGGELQDLHEAILAHDPRIDAPPAMGGSASGLERAPSLELRASPVSIRRARRPVQLPAALRSVAATAYVGRVVERARLHETLEAARGGARRVVLIGGEPGVGKTRLAVHTASEAHGAGFSVSWGAAGEDLRAPYGPWIEVLSHLVASAPEEMLVSHVATHGGPISRLVPSLGQRVKDIPPPQTSDPETERYLLFGAVAELLKELCEAQPVVVVLDDLQWADTESLALMLHIASATPREGLPLLILVTYRDTHLHAGNPAFDVLADLHRIEGGVERVVLGGLNVDEVAELMATRAGHDLGAEGVRLATELTAETGGNPFFVGEMLRHLRDSGVIGRADGARWRVRAPLTSFELPQSVREVVTSRVHRLGERAEAILKEAAVIGPTFDVELLELLVDADEDELLAALEAAIDGGLVVESPEVAGRLSFAHALIKQALYEQLRAVRRPRMHLKIARALEQLAGTHAAERLGELAHHWGEAGPAHAGTAARYARLAGERALEQLAPDDALRWFEKARDLIPAENAEQRERCDVLIGLGEAMRQRGDPSFRNVLLEAAEIATRLEDADRLTRAVLTDTLGPENLFGAAGRTAYGAAGAPDERRLDVFQHALDITPRDSPHGPRMMAIVARELYYGGQPDRAQKLSNDALLMTRGEGDRRELARVMALASSISPISPLKAHLEGVDELVRLGEEVDDPELRFRAANARFVYGMYSGDPGQLDSGLAVMLGLADTIGQPMLRWTALWAHSARRFIAGDLADAEALAEQAATVAGEPTHSQARTHLAQRVAIRNEQDRLGSLADELEAMLAANPGLQALILLRGVIAAEAGRREEARQVLERAAEERYPFPFDRTQAFLLSRCADLAMTLNVGVRVAELYDRLLPYREQFATPAGITSRGSVALVLGRLASRRGRFATAHEHLAAAERAHNRLNAPLFQARTSLARGESLLDEGGRQNARRAMELLDTALALAREHGSAAIEREVHALQTRLDT